MTPPITAIELHELSEQQVTVAEAGLYLKGLSPGIPALGVCRAAHRLAEARRFEHPAFDTRTAARLARTLARLIPRDALMGMLRRTNGLRDVADLRMRAALIELLQAALQPAEAAPTEAQP
jgi:hypothetical protein